MITKLERSIESGNSVLIENIMVEVDAVLAPLIGR